MKVVAKSTRGLAANVHVPAANTAAVVTYAAAPANWHHVISGLAWGYNGAPTNGSIVILSGAVPIFSIPVTSAGPGFIPFDPPQAGIDAATMTVTLAAGGGVVEGRLNVLGHFVEQT
jgi:hypothetical protein